MEGTQLFTHKDLPRITRLAQHLARGPGTLGPRVFQPQEGWGSGGGSGHGSG